MYCEAWCSNPWWTLTLTCVPSFLNYSVHVHVHSPWEVHLIPTWLVFLYCTATLSTKIQLNFPDLRTMSGCLWLQYRPWVTFHWCMGTRSYANFSLARQFFPHIHEEILRPMKCRKWPRVGVHWWGMSVVYTGDVCYGSGLLGRFD